MIVATRSRFPIIACAMLAAGSLPAMAEEDCSCVSVLDKVVAAVRDNYAGYQLKLPEMHDREIHAQYLELLREDALGLEPAACRRVIAGYLDFFADDHLFVLPPSKPRQAATESKADEKKPLLTVDPLTPQFRELGDGLYYLKLTSFMPQYREPLNALIEEHGDTLSQARGLIIDVRGNGGGDAIYFPLADWFLTGPIVVSEANAMLASDWNIQFFERFREQLGDRGGWLDPALERMRANRGDIVPYLDKRVEGPDNPQPGPRQIVVLQDGGVGSAAEAFLLHARQSDKVVTMGEPSKGNIDYQQVSIRTLQCGDYSVNFGWPLYMRSRELPRDSLDDSGVPPDVRLAPDADWMQYAERWLRAATK